MVFRLFLAAFLVVATTAFSAPIPEVDAIFAKWDKADTPGCALGVYRDGQTVYARGYGMADIAHAEPLGPESVFEIASVSKQFTAAIVTALALQGRLSLADPIRRWLPWVPASASRVTIDHLVHHTSGMRDYLDLAQLAGWGDYYTIPAALELIGRQSALNFAPGENYQYSNTGYFLLSQIVQAATGRTLRQLADELIFRPLAMNGTHIHDDYSQTVPRLALGYRSEGHLRGLKPPPGPRPDGKGFKVDVTTLEMVGDGGVYTTVADLAAWSGNFIRNQVGGLGVELLHEMLTMGKLSNGRVLVYGSGLHVDTYRGLSRIWHTGAFAGYRAFFAHFPSRKFGLAVLCNHRDISARTYGSKVVDHFLKDDFKDPAPPATVVLPVETLKPLVGWYRGGWLLGGKLWKVELDGKSLVARVAGWSSRLAAIAPDEFLVENDPEVRVRFSKGTIHAVRDGEEEAYLRRAVPAAEKPALAPLEGQYWSDELGTAAMLAVDGGVLKISMHGASAPLAPFTDCLFTGELAGQQLAIEANRLGSDVQGFRFSTDAARGILFRRRR